MISLIATHAIPRLNRLILLVRLDPMTSLTSCTRPWARTLQCISFSSFHLFLFSSVGSPPLGFYPIFMWIGHISYGCFHIHVDSPHLLWIPSVDYLPHLQTLDSLYDPLFVLILTSFTYHSQHVSSSYHHFLTTLTCLCSYHFNMYYRLNKINHITYHTYTQDLDLINKGLSPIDYSTWDKFTASPHLSFLQK